MKPADKSPLSALDWPLNAGTGDEVFRAVEARLRRRSRRRAAWAASGVALLATVSVLWQMRRPAAPPPSAVVLLPPQRTLPDGSVVELKDDAKISVDYSGEFRRVALLDGEAHFKVAKNPARPFVVSAGGVEVRAVGTAFSVRRENNAVAVLVMEGRVAVDRAAPLPSSGAAGPSLAFVNAGYRVVVDDRPRPELIPIPQVQVASTDELEDLELWRAPRVEFSGTSLAEAVVLLNRYSRKHLVIGDHGLEKLQLSGVLRADNTEALLRLLQANFGIVAERRGEGEIVLRNAR